MPPWQSPTKGTRRRSSARQTIDQALGAGTQGVKKAGLGNLAQRCEAASGGDRVAAECARLVDRASGR